MPCVLTADRETPEGSGVLGVSTGKQLINNWIDQKNTDGLKCVFVCVEFVPVSPSQGLTWAEDLSSRDLVSLGFITHIELSTFLLTLGIQIKRTRPPRRRTRGANKLLLNTL